MRKRTNKVDANQNELVELWRGFGAVAIPVSGDPEVGFDVILAFRGKISLVEVKDGNKPPSKQKLTPGELKRKEELESVECKLDIVTTPEEAVALLGF